MNRHKLREKLIFAVYQHLLLKKDLEACVAISFDGEVDEYVRELIELLKANESGYIAMVSPLLNKWSFDRLNYVDQAIILVATAELKAGRNDKAVIIDEAIKFAKTYCDDNAYRYINGVLDQIWRPYPSTMSFTTSRLH